MYPHNHSELERGLLADLPELNVPQDVWPAIEARMGDQQSASRAMHRRIALAIAAAVSLGILAILLGRIEDRQGQELTRWAEYTGRLETELRALERNTSVFRGHHAIAIDTLEDMLVTVDTTLADRVTPDMQLVLWQQRATLLHDLISVYSERKLANSTTRPVLTINPPVALATYQF